jgi:pimeloyl-ACP methyl ester carboxylesterase
MLKIFTRGTSKLFSPHKAKLHLVSKRSRKKVIIFIHGIFGHHEDTWKRDEENIGLPQFIQEDLELQDYDVYSFGYQSNWRISQYNYRSIARLLHSEIQASLPNNDIVFVVHSMGGIIVQQYIIDQIEQGNHFSVKNVKGIIYLSVPFEGSVYGNLFSKFHKQVSGLKKFSKELTSLKEKWIRHVFRKGQENLPANMRFFIPQLLLYGTNDKVVSQQSANPFHIDGDIFEVDEGHGSICKIDLESTVYKHIKQFLRNQLENVLIAKAMVLWVHGWDKQSYAEEADFILDWVEYFNIKSTPRLVPNLETWSANLIPHVEMATKEWSEKWVKQGGKVRIFAKCCLTGGLLIGNYFSRTRGVKLEVQHYSEFWNAENVDPLFKTLIKRIPGTITESSKAVILLSVSKDIYDEAKEYLSLKSDYDYRVMVNIMPFEGPGQNSIKTDAQAASYAVTVKEIADDLKKQGIKEIYMFLNMPFSTAVIVGHRLTAVSPIQTFEYLAPGYVASCRL